MAKYGGPDELQHWSFVTNIATTDTDITLVAAPATGRTLVVQVLTVAITTSAAQAVNIEDASASGAVQVFRAPASLAVGTYGVDAGPLGVALTAATALEWDAVAAGVGATVSGFGYIRD